MMSRFVSFAVLLGWMLAGIGRAQDMSDPARSPQRRVQGPPRATTSFDTLVGPLRRLLRDRGRPYLVTADIEVPADQTVTIEAGTVLLFRDFTGLHVQGRGAPSRRYHTRHFSRR